MTDTTPTIIAALSEIEDALLQLEEIENAHPEKGALWEIIRAVLESARNSRLGKKPN